MEDRSENIRVSIIYPPDTDTPMLGYEKQHGLAGTMALNKNIKIVSPEKVAKVNMKGS